MDTFIGQEVQVLLEGELEDMPNYLEGLDDHYMRVCVKAPIEQKTENAKKFE